MRRLGLTHKKKTWRAEERDREEVPQARAEFKETQPTVPVNKVPVIDEAGVNLGMVREYGWAPCGQRAAGKPPFDAGPNISLIGSLETGGMTACLLTPWDQWLQAALATSRQHLGDQWLDHYLTSPLWRLVLSSGVCGPQPYSGVLMPSVDRVGRYYPLLLAAPVADGADLLALTTVAWFAAAEQVALQALDDALDLDHFAAQVVALGPPPTTPQPLARDPLTWQVALTDLTDLSQIGQVLAGPLLGRYATGYSLWWTAGSDRIAPCLLLCQGLPQPERFTGLLTGDWRQAGWQGVGGYA